jgi:hypothetical protein
MHPTSGTNMRYLAATVVAVSLVLGGCTQQEVNSGAREAGRETREAGREVNEGARKAGRVAHEIADDAKAAAKKAAKAIGKASREAKEGWKEAEREDKARGK